MSDDEEDEEEPTEETIKTDVTGIIDWIPYAL